jgi:hypothetical protein
MQNRKLWRVVLPVVGGLLAGVGWLMMEQPHRDVGSEAPAFQMVPAELVGLLSQGDSVAAPYLNSVVELYAVVDADDGKRATFEGGVVASWDTIRPHPLLEAGTLLRVKGRVTGYDDLFEEVRMDGLVVVETPDR